VLGSPTNLFDLNRCCFQKAHAVVILQSGVSDLTDPHMADCKPIFTTKLIESQLGDGSPKIIVDLLFEVNHAFVPLTNRYIPKAAQAVRRQSWFGGFGDGGMVPRMGGKGGMYLPGALGYAAPSRTQGSGGSGAGGGATDKESALSRLEDSNAAIEPRFASGQLFVSTSVTSLLVNLLFNPSLVQVVQQLLESRFTIVDASPWIHKRYFQVVEDLLKQGYIAIAILRPMDSTQPPQKQSDANRPRRATRGPLFVYTAPNAREVQVWGGDKVMCIANS